MRSPQKFRSGSKLLAFLVALALLASACGSSTEVATDTDDGDTADETTDDVGTAEPGEAVEAVEAPDPDAINGGKPVVEVPTGAAPTELVVEDFIVGDGNEAAAGDLLVMHYVGVLFDDGSQFDASWDRDQTFSFVLGEGAVIQGWDEGIVGMAEGSRRQLTIPAAQAYGDNSPSPDIPPGSTLVFVVDLLGAHSPHDIDTTTGQATELEVTVLEEGDGPELAAGDAVEVLYSIAPVSSGIVEQSSWTDRQTGNFVIGLEPAQIFPGWSEGLVGANVGDELRIVVPPDLGPNPSDEDTLITQITVLGTLDVG